MRTHSLRKDAVSQTLVWLGGGLAIGSVSLFVNRSWEQLGGWGITTVALAGMALALWLARRARAARHTVPASLAACFAVALAPLAVYGLLLVAHGASQLPGCLEFADYRSQVSGLWLPMELATLGLGGVLLLRWRLPLLGLPVALALSGLVMDLAALLLGANGADRPQARNTAIAAGLVVLATGLALERRSQSGQATAFWFHLVGLATFCSSLSLSLSGGVLALLACIGVHLLLLAAGIVLARRVFLVFGGLGVASGLVQLACGPLHESLLFPLGLMLTGLLLAAAGLRAFRSS